MSVAGALAGSLGGIAGGDPLAGAGSALAQSAASVGLRVVDAWVLDGTRSALDAVARIIGTATAPDLTSAWFSATYWRVAGLASLLTLPFLFAAALQALLRSDPMLLARATLVHLPAALIGVSLAGPVVMLLLAATDEMSSIVAGTASESGARFLDSAAVTAGASSALFGSPFFAIVVGLLTVAAALALMLELLVREAAVYVVVLMLPLAFAALVWPARRVWATRLLELLVALILSKLAIVAVLSLAGSALGQSGGIPQVLTAMALVLLSCFAPWALLRIIPFTELAAHASEGIRHGAQQTGGQALRAVGAGIAAADGAGGLPGMLQGQAQAAGEHGAPPEAWPQAPWDGVSGAGWWATGPGGPDGSGGPGGPDRSGGPGRSDAGAPSGSGTGESAEPVATAPAGAEAHGSTPTGSSAGPEPPASGPAAAAGFDSGERPLEGPPLDGPLARGDFDWPPLALSERGLAGPADEAPPLPPVEEPHPTLPHPGDEPAETPRAEG